MGLNGLGVVKPGYETRDSQPRTGRVNNHPRKMTLFEAASFASHLSRMSSMTYWSARGGSFFAIYFPVRLFKRYPYLLLFICQVSVFYQDIFPDSYIYRFFLYYLH